MQDYTHTTDRQTIQTDKRRRQNGKTRSKLKCPESSTQTQTHKQGSRSFHFQMSGFIIYLLLGTHGAISMRLGERKEASRKQFLNGRDGNCLDSTTLLTTI